MHAVDAAGFLPSLSALPILRAAAGLKLKGENSDPKGVGLRGNNPKLFLARVEAGKTRTELRRRQIVFSQGDPANVVFSIRKGKIELKVCPSMVRKRSSPLWVRAISLARGA
jgi:CRP-like cAMP-binding protein